MLDLQLKVVYPVVCMIEANQLTGEDGTTSEGGKIKTAWSGIRSSRYKTLASLLWDRINIMSSFFLLLIVLSSLLF